MATPSLLNKVIEFWDRTKRYSPSGTGYSQVQVMKVGSFTLMIVFGIGDELWFPS